MSDQDIFNSSTEVTAPADPSVEDKSLALLASIKNRDGSQKYATVEAALKGTASAQDHISTLETQNGALRSQVDQIGSLEEAINRLAPTNTNPAENKPPEVTPSVASDVNVAKTVEDILNKREAEKAQDDNIQSLSTELVNRFGSAEKATGAIERKAQELGCTVDSIKNLASTNPQMALALFGQKTTESHKPAQNNLNINAIESITQTTPEGSGDKKGLLYSGATGSEISSHYKDCKAAVMERLTS